MFNVKSFAVSIIIAILFGSTLQAEIVATFSAADLEFFENKVRPLLVEHCYECHSNDAEEAQGGLLLDSRPSILAGGDTGAAIIPGNVDESLLIDAIRYGDLYQMPPKSRLPEEKIAILVEWVKRRAPWPEEKTHSTVQTHTFNIEERKNSHWVWQPIADPTVPWVSNQDWPLDPLDNFILAKLDEKQLQPAPTADAHVLIRRAYFDLVGLPPPLDAFEAFVADPSQEAFAAIVDQLLASQAFGQRWARHWLDLMRYAETRGHEFDYPIPNAWQYRDYVIRALNADVPYDDFVVEHLAGDLLENPRRNSERGFNESILGTAFWYLGDWVHSPVDVRIDEMNRFDNAIDVFGKSFLGLTIACARCHDHKFDAISQQDYYAMAGYLQSSAYRQVRFETLEHNKIIADQLDQLEREATAAIAVEIGKLGSQMNEQRLIQLLQANSIQTDFEQAWQKEFEKASQDEHHPLHPLIIFQTSGLGAFHNWCKQQISGSQQLSTTHQIVADYNDNSTPWLTDGPAYGAGARRQGDIVLSDSWQRPIANIVDYGFAELRPELANITLSEGTQRDPGRLHAWSTRPGRVLRTPSVELRGGKLYYLMRGGAQVHTVVASHRMVQGPLHGTHLKDIPASEDLRWVEHDLTPYRGQNVHVEFGARENEPLEIYLVVEGGKSPKFQLDTPSSVMAVELKTAKTQAEIATKFARLILESFQYLKEPHSDANSAHLVLAQWAASNLLLWTDAEATSIQALLDKYKSQHAEIFAKLKTESQTAPAIWDGPGEDEFLLIRGNARTPGPQVPRAILTSLSTAQAPQQATSGRLQLARQIASPENPLTARVITNRVWHHLMGRGIVPTVDDFGVLGQRPTHPELLDHLSQNFIREGWSIKSLIRRIMLSRTYQMASELDSEANELDPQNLLFHRSPTRRLQAEVIRDTMLSLTGQLKQHHTGPSIPVHLTSFMQGRGKPKQSGPLDGDGHRSIYIAVRRNFLSPMMLAFDAPQPNLPMGRRTVSNVPAQALILMNDPFVIEQAEHFAERLLAGTESVDQAIDQLYLEALSRSPRPLEIAAAKEFLAMQIVAYGKDPNESLLHQNAWADLCHTIFNTKEFIYLK